MQIIVHRCQHRRYPSHGACTGAWGIAKFGHNGSDHRGKNSKRHLTTILGPGTSGKLLFDGCFGILIIRVEGYFDLRFILSILSLPSLFAAFCLVDH
jgi:hypothetical protein